MQFILADVFVSKSVGRSRLFMFNPRYDFLDELKALLEKARSYYDPKEIEKFIMRRKRPRRAGKPLLKVPKRCAWKSWLLMYAVHLKKKG